MDSATGFSEILSSLMQNPEITKLVSSLAADSKKSEAEPAADVAPDSSPALSISPEMMGQIMNMASALSSGAKGREKESSAAPVSHSLSVSRDAQRSALLRALKPFLSERRRSLIDGLLQLEGLWGVLGAFRG